MATKKKRMNDKERLLAGAGTGAIAGGGWTALSSAGEEEAHKLHATMSAVDADMARFDERTHRTAAKIHDAAAESSESMARVFVSNPDIVDNEGAKVSAEEKATEASDFLQKAERSRFNARSARSDAAQHAARAEYHEAKVLKHTKEARKAKHIKIGSYAAMGVGGVAVGSAFYLRHRRGKVERVKMPKRSKTGK